MQDAPQSNPRKLFVGNLSFDTTKDTLVSVFSEFGKVEDAALITDRMSGRSRGIAFVTFSTEEEANSAIEALHETELDGRKIIVQVSRPPKRDNDRRGGFSGRKRFNNRRD